MADYIKYLSYLLSLTIYIDSFPHYFRNYINPNPPCQLSLCEETGGDLKFYISAVHQPFSSSIRTSIQ